MSSIRRQCSVWLTGASVGRATESRDTRGFQVLRLGSPARSVRTSSERTMDRYSSIRTRSAAPTSARNFFAWPRTRSSRSVSRFAEFPCGPAARNSRSYPDRGLSSLASGGVPQVAQHEHLVLQVLQRFEGWRKLEVPPLALRCPHGCVDTVGHIKDRHSHRKLSLF